MKRLIDCSIIALTICGLAGPAGAQTSTPPNADPRASGGTDEDHAIVVTARKRNETALDVPIAVTALGTNDLARYGTESIQSLTSRVPGLFATDASSSGTLAIRGIQSSAGNPAADQGVSTVVDGLQVGSPQILRLAQIDLQQIEVLKGPQALFFGKNSPGGVISLRTADPGPSFEGRALAAYEFESQERIFQGVLSGPLTDTLGVRVVGYYGRMDGDVKQVIPEIPGISYGPISSTAPNQEQIYLRGTLLFQPTDSLSLRSKISFSSLNGSNPFGRAERILCPYGAPQVTGLPTAVDDCKVNGVSSIAPQASPAMYAAGAAAGYPFDMLQHTKQYLATLEGNLEIAPDVTLTSITGYFKLTSASSAQISFQPAPYLGSVTRYERVEKSQELRLVTNKADWPVNFTVGIYFQDMDLPYDNVLLYDRYAFTRTLPLGAAISPQTYIYDSRGKTYSGFGQAIWKVTPDLELAAGARYSSEKRRISFTAGTTAYDQVAVALPVSSETFDNFSPEITALYKPQPNLSIYGGYRTGFKSGGFNAAGKSGDLSFDQETVRGFEGGVKGDLGDIRFTATAYTYKYKDAQVYSFNPSTAEQTVLNAASARIKGVEATLGWQPRRLPGLEAHASANYNHSRYLSAIFSCYTGQTIAEGCNAGTPLNGTFRQQDLSGRPLTLAPDWSGNVGMSYSTPLSEEVNLSVSGDMSFSSAYVTILEDVPGSRQPSFQKYDASVRLSNVDKTWELALIGINLTDERTISYGSSVPLTGISSRTGSNLTGGRADLYGFIARGREVRLQLSTRF